MIGEKLTRLTEIMSNACRRFYRGPCIPPCIETTVTRYVYLGAYSQVASVNTRPTIKPGHVG